MGNEEKMNTNTEIEKEYSVATVQIHGLKLKPAWKNNIKTCKSTCTHSNGEMHIKPKHVKLLRRATLSLLCFLCLLQTWKSDAIKINPGGMMLPRPCRASWQPTNPGRGEISPTGNCTDRDRQIILVTMCPFVTGNKSNFVIKTSQRV